MRPSRHTSPTSGREAEKLAANLGIRLEVFLIADGLDGAVRTIEMVSGAPLSGLALENLQARERGQILMALSNRDGAMLLSTGNKSKVSVGLRHALRRHVRWLQRAQGRLQDPGLCPGPLAQRRPPSRLTGTGRDRDPADHDPAAAHR